MIFQIKVDADNRVTGFRMISERGVPDPALMQVGKAPVLGDLRDGYGNLRHVADLSNGRVEITVREQDPTAEQKAKREERDRRAAVARALPDILLAASEGKDIGEATKDVLAAASKKESG